MAKDLPLTLIELLRHRHTCLYLSDSTGSFQWRFFSYRLLPYLRQNDEYKLKGAFKRDSLILIVPFSKLPNKDSVVGLSYSKKDMNKYDIPSGCDIYFVNTNFPTLDNICFAVYINNDTSYKDSCSLLEQLQKNKFLDTRTVVFVNDAFQMNSASFYNLIESVQKLQTTTPRLKLGCTLINLTGAQIGADSLDTPEVALAQSSKQIGDKAKIPSLEIDYNEGLGIEHISQLFLSNDNYVHQLKDNLRKRVLELRDSKLRDIEMFLEGGLFSYLDPEVNVAIIAKILSKTINELQLVEIIKFVSPHFLDQIEQLKSQSNIRENLFTKNWKHYLVSECNKTLERLKNS